MSNVFRIPSDREPPTDDSGQWSRSWYLFFQDMFRRVGGATGANTEDVAAALAEDSGIEEMRATAFASFQALEAAPYQQMEQQVETLTYQVNELRDLVAELTKEVQGIRSGTLI